ncbi:MAG: hypothetical protein KY392_02520, partial [Chloroflexi bacterium]|nr:hypothetical protein [Chloroflexota bacterium]
MIATNVRRLGFYLVVAFAFVSGSLVWWQVIEAPSLAARGDNPEVIAARRALMRGSIFDVGGQLLASSQVADGLSRRTYTDPAFTHVIGYATHLYGSTGIERAFEDILVGQTDPNPVRDLLNDILDRQPEPRDLTLTIDRRLQDFAAAQLGGDHGAVVALDPATGAVLAMVSTPTFDATAISGDPGESRAPMEALQADEENEPLLSRARQGRYVPGSIMKVFTAAAALDAGVITPSTTYEDQPRQEREGFVVDGFTIREHDLGGIEPGLWPLSESLQVSSNIYFAHVGLDLGPEAFLEYARRFGFCEPIEIGPPGRSLTVNESYVTQPVDGDCGPFEGDVELASASFGQGRVQATPVQMALVAAAVAGALDVKEATGQPLVETLTAFLRDKQLLLVLDNFEQVLTAGAQLTELLVACSSLTVLVTSRVALRLSGEHEIPVAPLTLPDLGQRAVSPAALVSVVGRCEAARFFVERARAVQPDFELTEEN